MKVIVNFDFYISVWKGCSGLDKEKEKGIYIYLILMKHDAQYVHLFKFALSDEHTPSKLML